MSEHSMGTFIEKDGKQGLIKSDPPGNETLEKFDLTMRKYLKAMQTKAQADAIRQTKSVFLKTVEDN